MALVSPLIFSFVLQGVALQKENLQQGNLRDVMVSFLEHASSAIVMRTPNSTSGSWDAQDLEGRPATDGSLRVGAGIRPAFPAGSTGYLEGNQECPRRPLGVLDVTSATVLLSVFSGGIAVGVAGAVIVLFVMKNGGSSESKSADCSTPTGARQTQSTLASSSHGLEEVASAPPQSTASTGTAAQDPSQPFALTDVHMLHSGTGDLESMHLFWPRAGCLVGLLLVQSLSSLIMAGFRRLFEANPVLVFFLTMIVGTGGNVGGQAVVIAVRKLALGKEVGVFHEALVGLKLCVVLVPVAFVRCWAQQVSMSGSMTVAISVLAVVLVGALLGAGLPKMLFSLKIDPAHAIPIIQVVMDILGVCIICCTGLLLLNKNGTGEGEQ